MSAALFQEIREFVAFSAVDEANLTTLKPVIEKHGAAITRRFYDVLGNNPTTSALIEGRVDRLKTTHSSWLTALVGGDWGEGWFEAQIRIGHVHVKLGISPLHVELTYSLLRSYIIEAIREEIDDAQVASDCARSVVKGLDMSLALVNHAYADERLNRLSGFTGFSRKLIENYINKSPKD